MTVAVTAAQIEALMKTLSKIDWKDALLAVSSGFADKAADEALAENVFDVIAPILAPYIIAAVGLEAIPGLGLLLPLLAPAIALAVMNFQGGDPDPIHDAQTTRTFNPGDPAARL
jgi:hypothetical protein